MRRMLVIVVGLGLVGVCPSAATAQSQELAALAAHVQALQTTITAQAGQITALQAATGTATVPSLAEDEAGVFPFNPQAVYEGATNTSLGTDALASITTGEGSTAIGANALRYNTDGDSF